MSKLSNLEASLKELALFWKKELPPLVLRIYLKFLMTLSEDEFNQALESWILSGTSFPTPENLLAQVGRSPNQQAEKEWKILSSSSGKISKVASEISKSLKVKMELGRMAFLSAQQYNYQEQALKKSFLDEYKKRWLEACNTGNFEEFEATKESKEEPKKEPKEETPISSEDWKKLKEQLKNFGVRLGDSNDQ
jgi:hypothetical protein